MNRVAVATSAGDDVDPDARLLLDALRDAQIEGQLCVWGDERVDWNGFDLVVIRSTWDYTAQRESYLTWARGIERLWNPFPVIEYSTDKHYLLDLERRGHRIVPTTLCDVGAVPRFPDVDFVVKPAVGAGSRNAEKYRAHERDRAVAHVARLHALGRDVVIQPYVGAVDTLGERALVFIDGAFSHAMTKGAMLNVTELDRNALFRIEQMSVAHAEPDALGLANAVLAEDLFEGLLYARVDLVCTDDGWAVMELELVEPSLFLWYDEEAPRRLARAIRRRLAASTNV